MFSYDSDRDDHSEGRIQCIVWRWYDDDVMMVNVVNNKIRMVLNKHLVKQLLCILSHQNRPFM